MNIILKSLGFAAIGSLILTSCSISKPQKVSEIFRNSKSKEVLLVGIDPKKLDFTKITNLTEQELSTALETQKQKLITAGYNAEWCLVDLGMTAEKTVKDKLSKKEYDLVLIGAGIRTLPDNFILFENLINIIHQYAPNSQIGFNTNQNDTEISVHRRVKLKTE
ncbi:hypothetical protein IRZ71_05940 [Flavobacterium sp. ANB]|uniref:hypothetical protein n=1 Tax=unclassified Flavobacterium TaxID=196869 RepID=UPI0012B756C9|nr:MULTISPECIES: hypothetical protein [unclassified Flavobacterium]MBF4515872.1 hypothetical protein [Flavobacterium sp. ANB]MTD68874.1 hypothetical protein [Flavobacterium sp. LC2016-13]